MKNNNHIFVQGGDGSSLTALVSGDYGWLMYLRHSEDPGFSSRNPEYTGPDNAMRSYELDNGQNDEYPESWVYPIEIIKKAIISYKETNKPPSLITWHNDSGDGVEL